MSKKKLIALIPARSGSQRLKNKNILSFKGKPLIANTIIEAKKTKLFDKILVSTDSVKYAKIAKKFGADVPFLRPKKFSKSTSPDYQWVKHAINYLEKEENYYDFFFILRPTNPFRTSFTIKKAWNLFLKNKNSDTLRAVELCKQHPEKMWTINDNIMKPLKKKFYGNQPSFNMQYKSLDKIYVQNACLEISKVSNLKKYKTITGKKIIPFKTLGIEGFDINYPEDYENAKKMKIT